jgi:surface antigen
MLSFDRNRKRKNVARRSRGHLNPPVLESIPRSTPVEQIPFPEYIYGSTNANLFRGQRPGGPLCIGTSQTGLTAPTRPLPGQVSVMGKRNLTGMPDMAGGLVGPGNSFGSFPVWPPSAMHVAVHSLRPSFPGTMFNSSCETEVYSDSLRLSTQQFKRLEAQDTERVTVVAASCLNRLAPLRSAVFIQGAQPAQGQVRMGIRPPEGRRAVVGGAATILLLFVLLGSCIAGIPMHRSDYLSPPGLFRPMLTSIALHRSENALIAGEYATAIAITQDGYDPGNTNYRGLPMAPFGAHISTNDAGNLSRFFYGQCTYWANMRYHQLTHHWIPWLGNAYQWAYEAPAYGWTIADTPDPNGPSIMVFSPYSEGAGAYGHVAVVEHTNSDGSVYTSNWNWDGLWATQSWMNFYPGNGVSFIWFPHS